MPGIFFPDAQANYARNLLYVLFAALHICKMQDARCLRPKSSWSPPWWTRGWDEAPHGPLRPARKRRGNQCQTKKTRSQVSTVSREVANVWQTCRVGWPLARCLGSQATGTGSLPNVLSSRPDPRARVRETSPLLVIIGNAGHTTLRVKKAWRPKTGFLCYY